MFYINNINYDFSTFDSTMWFVFIILIAVITGFVWALPAFGQLPKGIRKKRIAALPSFSDGELINLSVTTMKAAQFSYWDMMREFFFGDHPNRIPVDPMPVVVSDFQKSKAPTITWFGHSSYLLKVNGLNILVDPVLNDRPSPFIFLGSKPFKGTAAITVDKLPVIDLILLTHDHYDHLSYRTIKKLDYKNVLFICALGVGAHLERWGVPSEHIQELAWDEHVEYEEMEFTATSARHFSGRRFKRNQTVWAGFVLKVGAYKFYLGGDSGYDSHFKSIGEQFGPFDLAVLECGQYNEMWPMIHMMPEQMVKAAKDLRAKLVLPVHWGKFSLALHPWKEPIERVFSESKKQELNLLTPKIGETVTIGIDFPNTPWWRELT